VLSRVYFAAECTVRSFAMPGTVDEIRLNSGYYSHGGANGTMMLPASQRYNSPTCGIQRASFPAP